MKMDTGGRFFLVFLTVSFCFFVKPIPCVEAQEDRLNTLSAGVGDDVVLIHGSYGSLEYFKFSIFDDLAKNHHVFAFDMPGHGKSPRSKKVMTLEDHADSLHAEFKKLGITRPVLVGHSWGGAVVLAYVLKYPEEAAGIVLLGAYTAPYKKLELIYRVTTIPVIGDIFAGLIVPLAVSIRDPRSIPEHSFYPDKAPENYAKIMVSLAIEPGAFKANAEDIKSLGPALQRMQSHYHEIKIPVVIIAGDSDTTSPYQRHALPLHRAILHSKLILLNKTGHQPAFARPDTVIKAIESIRLAQKG